MRIPARRDPDIANLTVRESTRPRVLLGAWSSSATISWADGCVDGSAKDEPASHRALNKCSRVSAVGSTSCSSTRGLQYWCDVAVTSAVSACRRSASAYAKTDGAAARAEEAVKRYRYHCKAVPIVIEADGRPGPSCLAFIRKFARTCSEDYSASPARAWCELSSMLQAGNAEIELASWGFNTLKERRVDIYSP